MINALIETKDLQMTPLQIRQLIADVEDKMLELPDVKLGDCCPLKHSFGDGLYVREITMPPGFLSTTKIHKFAHPAFIMKGVVSILEESGVKKVIAPAYIMTKAGTKRIVYCHTEVIWITVHATESTDIDEIEKEIIAKNFNEIK